MSEPAVLYEIGTEPAAVDLPTAATAIVCRTSYTAVARAVAAYEAGEREPVGTPGHLAALVWRGIQEYRELVGDASHSARVETATNPALSKNKVDQRVPDLTRAYVGE